MHPTSRTIPNPPAFDARSIARVAPQADGVAIRFRIPEPLRAALSPMALLPVGLLLLAGNVGAWLWAWSLFADRPALLSTALLAYMFGLRHAVDPDHIAAIDNVTRKLMQAGRRPVAVGFWFALGHSTVVVVAAGALALATTSLLTASEEFRQLGNLIGTGVSAGFLILIGLDKVTVRNFWSCLRKITLL